MYKEKTNQAVDILKEFDINLWLTFVRESHTIHDPSLDYLYPGNLTWQSAMMITSSGVKTAIVGNLDSAAVEETKIFDKVLSYKTGIKDILLSFLKETNPNKIAINFSINSEMADGLSHGMYLILNEYLEGTEFEKKLVSSEDIISALRGRKSEEELRRLRKAAEITSGIFDEVTKFLQPGKTEKEVAAFVHGILTKRGLEPSWDIGHCPSVFTGPDTAGAHFGPTDRKIKKGHVLNMDFGVKIEDYVSDMQRTWYILRDGESSPPDEVLDGFDTIYKSIRIAADAVKPGVQGYIIDKAARDYIISRGYEEYPHALGHQVGRAAHDGAGLFCPEWERYAERSYMKIEKGQVYTIEPRLEVEGHGTVTIEEEIVVTDDGCEFLTQPQEEIYLIG